MNPVACDFKDLSFIRKVMVEVITISHYNSEIWFHLTKEQVSDEVIAYYGIEQGDFDTISGCRYSVPSFLDIGKLYSIMIEDCAEPGNEVEELMKFLQLQFFRNIFVTIQGFLRMS